MVQMIQRANMCAADRVSAERTAMCAENVLDYAQALIRFTSKAAGILSALSLLQLVKRVGVVKLSTPSSCKGPTDTLYWKGVSMQRKKARSRGTEWQAQAC